MLLFSKPALAIGATTLTLAALLCGCVQQTSTTASSTSTSDSATGAQSQTSQEKSSDVQSGSEASGDTILMSNDEVGGISVEAGKISMTLVPGEEGVYTWTVELDGEDVGELEGGHVDEDELLAVVVTKEKIDDTSVKLEDGTYKTEIKGNGAGTDEYTFTPKTAGTAVITFNRFDSDVQDTPNLSFTLNITVNENGHITAADADGVDFNTMTAPSTMS